MSKKYLITGSNGFIGNNLLQEVNKKHGICYAFEEEDLIYTNWQENLENIVKEIDVIFHVGAVSSTDASDVNKVMFLNYEFSKILFDLAAKYDKKVIYSSSCAIYGDGNGVPKNLYAWSKKAAEDYGLLKVKEFISLRYTNVYGAGEAHKNKMASVACQAFHANYFAREIQKQHKFSFPLLPKKPTRDFVYVKDVISANIFASGNDIKSNVYEVGSGESRPFEDVLKLLNISFHYLPEDKIPPWYQFYTCSNPDKFLPGWKPQYNLEKGLTEYKKYLCESV